jgi:hypothetical protein
MKKTQQGFSAVEVLLVLVFLGLIGGVGWYVWQVRNTKSVASSQADKATKVPTKTKETNRYNFTELGISMDILPGWTVKRQATGVSDSTFVTWEVSKSGAEAQIQLASTGFSGGFSGCQTSDQFEAASIEEIMPTRRPDLLYMRWNSETDRTEIIIIKSDQEAFYKKQDFSASVVNHDLTAGSYYFCAAEPAPGFTLGLNKDQPKDTARRDFVYVRLQDGSGTNVASLSSNSPVLADIKAMLLSID